MSTPSPTFRRGAAAIKAATSGDFTPFQKTEYLAIKSGERALIRFLTDYDATNDPATGELVGGWLGVKQHQNVKTCPPPADYKGSSWPQRMAAPCRRDPNFAGVYNDCYICDVIKPADPLMKAPSHRLYALAVLREEAVVDGKRVIRDQKRKVSRRDANGNESETEEPRIVVVNMGKKNFFDPLSAWATRFGTILDRDYEVTRQGDGLDTTYLIIPEMEQQYAQKADGTTEVFDLREDEFMARYYPEAIEVGYAKASDLHLEPVITEKTTDDFYGRFFNPTWTGNEQAPASAPVEAPEAVYEAPVASYEAPAPAPAPTVTATTNVDDLKAMIEQLQS